MARPVDVFVLAVASWGVLFGLRTGVAQPAVVIDPPGITVFPIHDAIGTEAYPLARAVADGRRLFRTKFNLADGAGRPEATGDSKPTPRTRMSTAFQRVAGPDANSCAGCHNDPLVGGSGEFATNTFVGAHLSDPFTLSTSPAVTNERGTVSLFGTGAVELLAREMSSELLATRDRAVLASRTRGEPTTVALVGKTTRFGRITAHPDGSVDYGALQGVDYDLIVKPFGVKGVASSLREFTTFALNQHHGIQAVERFGWERTGRADFDGDGFESEFTIGQVTALVLFQASLPPPNTKDTGGDGRGAALFRSAGCAECHTPAMQLASNVFTEPGRFNRPGAMSAADATQVQMPLDLPRSNGGIVVQLYSDLKRHQMCDSEVAHFCNEQLRQDNVRQDLFITMRLWDLATSAPYGHRGDCTTLSEVIAAHGGEGRRARDQFLAMIPVDRRNVLEFLLSLGRSQSIEE